VTQRQTIAIVGAGIGGLTAAVSLQQRGFQVTVYEQSAELGDVGAGLTISANAGRVLTALGLTEQMAELEMPTPHIGSLHPMSGARLNYEIREYTQAELDVGAVTRQVHRADLHSILADALKAPADTLRLQHKLVDVKQEPNQVHLGFENGETASHDLLIACDGLKSVVRRILFCQQQAEFTGFVAWRGLVPRNQLNHQEFDPHFATYPDKDKLIARYPVRGGSLINYVAIARKAQFKSESWHQTAKVSEVLDEFRDWHSDVVEILRATPQQSCMRWALYTRRPLTSWVKGRVGLLGDAAHPMTPFYGMGAAMAIEDAYVLARCLNIEGTSGQEALQRYQRARFERGNHMQKISLQRAESYMGQKKSQRALTPGAGLESMINYDPVTVEI